MSSWCDTMQVTQDRINKAIRAAERSSALRDFDLHTQLHIQLNNNRNNDQRVFLGVERKNVALVKNLGYFTYKRKNIAVSRTVDDARKVCMLVDIHMHIQLYTHIYMYLYIYYQCTCIYVYRYIYFTYKRIYTYIYIYIYVCICYLQEMNAAQNRFSNGWWCSQDLYVYLYVYISINTHIQRDIYAHGNISLYEF